VQSSSQTVSINKPIPSFLQAGWPSRNPNKSVKALKAESITFHGWAQPKLTCGSSSLVLVDASTKGSRLPSGRGVKHLISPLTTVPRYKCTRNHFKIAIILQCHIARRVYHRPSHKRTHVWAPARLPEPSCYYVCVCCWRRTAAVRSCRHRDRVPSAARLVQVDSQPCRHQFRRTLLAVFRLFSQLGPTNLATPTFWKEISFWFRIFSCIIVNNNNNTTSLACHKPKHQGQVTKIWVK